MGAEPPATEGRNSTEGRILISSSWGSQLLPSEMGSHPWALDSGQDLSHLLPGSQARGLGLEPPLALPGLPLPGGRSWDFSASVTV